MMMFYRNVRSSSLYFCWAFVVLALPSHHNIAAAQEDRAVIVVFGDSITAGFCRVPSVCGGIDFAEDFGRGRINYGYPSIELTKILEANNRPSVVPNWGVGGSPSGPSGGNNGRDRIIPSLQSSDFKFSGSPRIVLIMYGTNDFGFGLSASETGFNNRVMIQRAKSQGYIPVVATLTPRVSRSVASQNIQIRAAAAAESAPLVDMFVAFNAGGGSALLSDGLHPNLTGYRLIAQTWFDEFLEDALVTGNLTLAPIVDLILSE